MNDAQVADLISEAFCASVSACKSFHEPYTYHLAENVLPAFVARELNELPFSAPDLGGVSGRRELHNEQRSYFSPDVMERIPLASAVAEAFQSPQVTRCIAKAFDALLDETFLRLEYAVDADGFWLEPHTDLGVKKFTCLIYLSDGLGHEDLGTDIYGSKDQHVGRSPFRQNSAMIFVPSAVTWHGFEKRPINGLRKSLILNYVTQDWRAREQLSFPDRLIHL